MATKQEDTVEFQLIERTLLHYLCFSNDALIDDALNDPMIAIPNDKKAEYKAQIKKNNEAHVIAALNQKKDGNKYVITLSDLMSKLNIYNLQTTDIQNLEKIISIATLERNPTLGGKLKSKTKKVRKIRRQIGGEINSDKLKAIHAYIAENCNINLPAGMNTVRAKGNFKIAAAEYKKVENPVKIEQKAEQQQPEVTPSNENIAAAVAAAYYYTKNKKKALAMVPKQVNDEFFKIVSDKTFNDITNFELTDFNPENKDFFLFKYDNQQYIYEKTYIEKLKNADPVPVDISVVKNKYGVDDVDAIVKNIIEQLGGLSKPKDKKDYEVFNTGVIPDTFKDVINDFIFTNCGIYQALGDGNCLIHSFLFVSPAYRKINMWRSESYQYHSQIAVSFRKWLSENLPQEIFDKVGSEVEKNGEFNSFDEYKAYLYTKDRSNNNPLSTNDASILANLFNVHIDILFGNTTAPYFQRISCGESSDKNIVIMNQYGGHFDIVLCEDKNASNGDKYKPFILRNPSTQGGTRRRIGKKQNQPKTYRK